jgi:hypothetical protein
MLMGLSPCLAVAVDEAAPPAQPPAIVTHGAEGSLVREIESSVIIPGDSHDDLWVHPELMSLPGDPLVIELRLKSTDRFGKDRHEQWLAFRTDDKFETLSAIPAPTASIWKRVGTRREDLKVPPNGTVSLPPQIGHTWCSGFQYVDAATIIFPFTTKQDERFCVQSLTADYHDGKITPLYVSDAHTIPVGRGLYEPHIAIFEGRAYMTARAEDGHGYVMVSDDEGMSWSAPRPWQWDDGQDIPMNQTMTKFAAHSNGLALVYTRISEDNANVFRNRAPLYIADIDTESLRLKRETERVLVSNRSATGSGLPVGNFWVWPVDQQETYVTVAEWPRDGRPDNGDIWLAKIRWDTPNLLLTPDGHEAVTEPEAEELPE